jgi:DNA N-6-adenine-methyltransferase (Dam)
VVLWITEQPNVASKTKTPFGGSWSCHKRSVCVWGSPGLAATAGFDRPTLCASSIIVDRTPMALHEQSVGATDEWFTPPYVFDALGCEFDMDVASSGQDLTPWIPARRFVTCHGLAAPWSGFVWMNPPFGPRNGIVPWLEKFFPHGNGIALVPDRTSAPWWQRFAPKAELILFVSPKIKFLAPNGIPGSSPAQGTSLLAVGQQGCAALRRAAANGLGVLLSPVSAP